MKKIAAVIILLGTLPMFGQNASSPQPASQAATPQVVTPKEPYSSAVGQLAVTREENYRLNASALQASFQQQMQDLQSKWKAAEAVLNDWIASVKKDNGWDDSYTYDRVGDRWIHTPKAETKPAEAPKK